MLMSDSIGGNAKTLMFVNVSPGSLSVGETESSLRYAERIKGVQQDTRSKMSGGAPKPRRRGKSAWGDEGESEEARTIRRLEAELAQLRGAK
jgi:kinesin family protein C2/C3